MTETVFYIPGKPAATISQQFFFRQKHPFWKTAPSSMARFLDRQAAPSLASAFHLHDNYVAVVMLPLGCSTFQNDFMLMFCY